MCCVGWCVGVGLGFFFLMEDYCVVEWLLVSMLIFGV